jgi:hypothetical protein
MQATLINLAAVGVMSLASMTLAAGGYGIVQSVAFPARSLSVDVLDYKDGLIIQKIIPRGGFIRGEWAAEIMRGERQLCSGGGIAPYDGGAKVFTPSEWTGGNCPPLQPGDIARASWEYTGDAGVKHTISKTIYIE